MNYYSRKLSNDATLKLAPISSLESEMAGLEAQDTSGYFLTRTQVSDPSYVEVIAQVHSDEAAFQLSLLLGLD